MLDRRRALRDVGPTRHRLQLRCELTARHPPTHRRVAGGHPGQEPVLARQIDGRARRLVTTSPSAACSRPGVEPREVVLDPVLGARATHARPGHVHQLPSRRQERQPERSRSRVMAEHVVGRHRQLSRPITQPPGAVAFIELAPRRSVDVDATAYDDPGAVHGGVRTELSLGVTTGNSLATSHQTGLIGREGSQTRSHPPIVRRPSAARLVQRGARWKPRPAARRVEERRPGPAARVLAAGSVDAEHPA